MNNNDICVYRLATAASSRTNLSRMLLICWALGWLVLSNAYKGSYVARLMTNFPVRLVDTFQEVADRNDIQVHINEGSSTEDFIMVHITFIDVTN